MMTRNTMKTGAIILLVSAALFLVTCNNLMDAPKSGKETGTVTFSVAEDASRTVVPTVEIASYELWGAKTTGGNQTLIKKFDGGGASGVLSVNLEVGVWNFTLNALNAEGTVILQDTQEGVTVTERNTETIVFDLKTFSGTSENGSIKITVNYFPQIPGIDQVEVIFNNEPSQNVPLSGGAPYVFERSNVSPGDYQLILKFNNNANPTVMTIMEIIKVKARLTSEKVIDLAKPDSGQDFFTDVVQTDVAQGATLKVKMDEFYTDISNYRSFLIEVTENDSINNFSLHHANGNMYFRQGVSITLRGTGAGITVSLPISTTGRMFTIGKNVTFTLENITLEGNSANDSPLVYVEDGGTLILNNGAMITGNINSFAVFDGGGVHVASGGSLIMNEGRISGNSATNGGGVYVDIGGSFEMNGGVIAGNTATVFGGGVYVDYDDQAGAGGSFTMTRGRITGDNNAQNGNGRAAYYNKAFGFFRDSEINTLSSDYATNWEMPTIQPLRSGEWFTPSSMGGSHVFSFTANQVNHLHIYFSSGGSLVANIYNSAFDLIDEKNFARTTEGIDSQGLSNLSINKTYYVVVDDVSGDFKIAFSDSSTLPTP